MATSVLLHRAILEPVRFQDARTAAPTDKLPGDSARARILEIATRESKPAVEAVEKLPTHIQALFVEAGSKDTTGKTTQSFTDILLKSDAADSDTHKSFIGMLETAGMTAGSDISDTDAVQALKMLQDVFQTNVDTTAEVERPLTPPTPKPELPSSHGSFASQALKAGTAMLVSLSSAAAQETCTNPTPDDIDDMCSRRKITVYEKLATIWLRKACKAIKNNGGSSPAINQLCIPSNLRGSTLDNCAQKLRQAVAILNERDLCVPKEDSFWATKNGEALYVGGMIAGTITLLICCCTLYKYKQDGKCWG